ncbi:RNA 2',3'-cyclic phosphodiesterase [Candidatus Dependentiae bacterium]
MNRKRLFVAVEIPQEVKQELSEICEHFQERELFVGRCTPIQNLHVTLKFIGSVAEDVIQNIDASLKNVYANACQGTLGSLGVLPTRRISRILFAHLDCFCLPILAKQIEQELSWIVKPEDRGFKNHITIARIKSIENKENFLYAVDNFQIKPLIFDIKEFLLQESELTPDGPIYTTVASYSLF